MPTVIIPMNRLAEPSMIGETSLVEAGMREMGLVLRYCTVSLVINPFFILMGLNSFLELMITLIIHPKV